VQFVAPLTDGGAFKVALATVQKQPALAKKPTDIHF
jgi:hypothetical protein